MDKGTAMHISGKGLILISTLLLVACDSKQDQSKKNSQEQAVSEPIQVENPDVFQSIYLTKYLEF